MSTPSRLRGGPLRASAALAAAAAFALSASARAAAAQSRETLETKVVAREGLVFLSWGKRHPWDAELQRGDVRLVAEYRTRDGAVAVDCLDPEVMRALAARRGYAGGYASVCQGLRGAADGSRDGRTLRFHLPESLTATPTGPVCLIFRMPNQRALPLRRAGEGHEETARFRAVEWEGEARRRSELASARARLDAVTQAHAAKVREIQAQEASNARDGWRSAEACEGIRAPSFEAIERTRPVAEADDADVIARRVCILWVRNADEQGGDSLARRLRSGRVQPPAVLDRVASSFPRGGATSDPAGRRAELEQYRRDWQQWAPRVRAYLDELRAAGFAQPHFGAFDDVLQLQTITREVGDSLATLLSTRTAPPPTFVDGFVGANVEAYTRCVADGRAQLATSLRNARELRERSPALQERARRTLVDACRRGTARLEALRQEQRTLEAERVRMEQALQALATPSARTGQPRELNFAACVP